MDEKAKQKAARLLVRSQQLFAEGLYAPKIYTVGEHTYWFLNAARRAAYIEGKPIETMSIAQAFLLYTGQPMTSDQKERIYKRLDQNGETYGEFLFCDTTVRWNSQVVRVHDPY